MNFIASASTDIGIKKNTNQDSLSVKVINTPAGRLCFAIICDGMGGLEKGEVASRSVIEAFDRWVYNDLPQLCQSGIDDYTIRSQWGNIVYEQNERIKEYGRGLGVNLGTTVAVLLLTENRYYILNVGDSRVYQIDGGLSVLTKDQTLVAQEVEMGMLTPEQAAVDPRRNVLLQCVGASDTVTPDFFFGDTQQNAVYMLCSDGFRHEISAEEIYQWFEPNRMVDEYSMKQNMDSLIELNKSRMETDNISVITVRTF